MKNLAEFKKAATLNSLWECVAMLHTFVGRDEHDKPVYKPKSLGIRPVVIVQTNSIAFQVVRTDGEIVASWLWWPKAKECKFIGNNTIEVYEGNTLSLVYKLIDQPPLMYKGFLFKNDKYERLSDGTCIDIPYNGENLHLLISLINQTKEILP